MPASLLALAGAAAILLESNAQGERYFRVAGGAQGTLAVFVAGNTGPAMLGTQSRAGADLVFVPRFALQPGVRYRAEFTRGSRKVAESFELAAPAVAAGGVVQVYPSSDQLPENQLKLYLHFATPMARGEIYRHVRLLDAEGREIEQPFLELAQELWDPELRRCTVLFDPGRVKRDLVPNREVGTPLRAGRSYELVIDAQLRDAKGGKLRQEYRKRFNVGAADRVSPQPGEWRVEPPGAGSRSALAVVFPESLDHGLLQHSIRVQDAAGGIIAGAVSVDREETRWSFQPELTWARGDYHLVIDTALEDLAGNRIGRLFDEEMSAPTPQALPATVTVGFRVE